MKNVSSKSEKKFQRVMHEFGQGELKSHGKKVTDQKQALAIAFSEARKVYPNYGMENGGAIPNNYQGKTAEEIWSMWTPKQRTYFLQDHFSSEDGPTSLGKTFDADVAVNQDWKDLPEVVRIEARNHIHEGQYHNGGGITGEQAAALAQIYKTGTAKELWGAWTPDNRIHFLMDHSTEYFELMGDDFYKSSKGFSALTYDTLPSPIRKSLLIHHAQGIYSDGGGIKSDNKINEGIDLFEDYENIPPKVQKILDKYADGFEEGDYDVLKKALSEVEKQGYTFEYYLDGQAYDLRKIGEKGKSENMGMNAPSTSMAGGGGIPGSKKKAAPKFAIGDKVMVDDTGYAKKFEGFDLTKPATIRDINKSKSGGKTYYFYKLEMANGDKPFNQAEEDTLTLVSMAGGGSIPSNLSPSKKKLLDRINTLKATKANAGEAAQKSIQKKIDVLQRQFDYNPSAKEKAMANKGKFALDVPASYSKTMYRKLWAMNVFPQIHKLNGTHSIVVNSKANLDKAYKVFSDMLKEKKEKVPSLASISRKL